MYDQLAEIESSLQGIGDGPDPVEELRGQVATLAEACAELTLHVRSLTARLDSIQPSSNVHNDAG